MVHVVENQEPWPRRYPGVLQCTARRHKFGLLNGVEIASR